MRAVTGQAPFRSHQIDFNPMALLGGTNGNQGNTLSHSVWKKENMGLGGQTGSYTLSFLLPVSMFRE